MTADPAIGFTSARDRVARRLQQLGEDLRTFSIESGTVNAEVQISLAMDDIDNGWRQILASAEGIAGTDAAVALELLLGLERIIDGAFLSGTLLTRDETVARRFEPKAPMLARAARAQKNESRFDKQVQIIKQEIKAAGVQRGNLSPDGLAAWILEPVNKRLREEDLVPVSKTTIWRRIRDFNL
ncbi:hypothetical protein [Methylobacterium sp. J-090]|uniref:hypothetical protein n=1 Tax=Methylobacterium sp. J-090 TaxID=2836666 RepID=UPI001FBB206E|nr:hypothetical protein [Methylobacterium sp. J-090]MCJ2082701.1 hypothetical protein [Methylobacterium sp. J-090]